MAAATLITRTESPAPVFAGGGAVLVLFEEELALDDERKESQPKTLDFDPLPFEF